MEVREKGLHWLDYVVFGASLCLSLSIGVFYAIKDCMQKQHNVENYFVGNRNMNVIVVAASVFVSFSTAVGVLGNPVEVYRFGLVNTWMGLGLLAACPVVAHFFACRFNRMKITSVFEFLERRFDRRLRVIVPIFTIMSTLIYVAIGLFATALSINQATGLDVHVVICAIGGVCLVYTTIGGMKAVLWADTVQLIIMMGAFVATVIIGLMRLGGITNLLNIAHQGGRLNFMVMTPDPFLRATSWAYFLGAFARSFGALGTNQMYVQRYACLSSPCKATLSVYLTMPVILLFVILFTTMGLLIHGIYAGCDPILTGQIQQKDQVLPLLIMELLGDIPGMVGLFLAALLCATLSTMSSAENGMAVNILKDILEPIHKRITGNNFSEKANGRLAPLLAFLTGILTTAIAIGIIYLNSSIFAIGAKVGGVLGGPVSGLFVLGVCAPFVDGLSALIGFVASTGVVLWIGIGSLFVRPRHSGIIGELPMSTDGCSLNYTSSSNYTTHKYTQYFTLEDTGTTHVYNYTTESTTFKFEDIYGLSANLYAVLGLGLCVLFGIFFGLIRYILPCGSCKKSDDLRYKVEVYRQVPTQETDM